MRLLSWKSSLVCVLGICLLRQKAWAQSPAFSDEPNAVTDLPPKHLPICRNDDVGKCMFQNGGSYLSYCGGTGDHTIDGFLYDIVEENWCHSSMLADNVCCGGGPNCCQIRWGKLVGVCVGVSVGLTVLCTCLCCVFSSCCCTRTKKKKIIKHIDNTTNLQLTVSGDELFKAYSDGLVKYGDGGPITYPDGSILYPDGSILYQDGTLQCADGTIQSSDGSFDYPAAEYAEYGELGGATTRYPQAKSID